MLIAKPAIGLLTSEELEKLLDVSSMPHSSFVCSLNCNYDCKGPHGLTIPPNFTTVVIFLTSAWYGGNTAQSTV